jgi:hypothetical protein
MEVQTHSDGGVPDSDLIQGVGVTQAEVGRGDGSGFASVSLSFGQGRPAWMACARGRDLSRPRGRGKLTGFPNVELTLAVE